MKRQPLLTTLAAMIVVLVSVSMAGAFDTSPYLAGTWEGLDSVERNLYRVVNVTTKPLDIYVFWYQADGSFIMCNQNPSVAANGMIDLYVWPGIGNFHGAVKFFAFPAGSKKFDPSVVIGGFQGKALDWSPPYTFFNTEANLKAVTINSYTIGEFAQVLERTCN